MILHIVDCDADYDDDIDDNDNGELFCRITDQ